MNEAQAQLRRFHMDTQYYEAHREELLERYPEQWVAIYDKQVVGTAPDFDQLLDGIESRGMSVGQVLVQHLSRKDELLILHS